MKEKWDGPMKGKGNCIVLLSNSMTTEPKQPTYLLHIAQLHMCYVFARRHKMRSTIAIITKRYVQYQESKVANLQRRVECSCFVGFGVVLFSIKFCIYGFCFHCASCLYLVLSSVLLRAAAAATGR